MTDFLWELFWTLIKLLEIPFLLALNIFLLGVFLSLLIGSPVLIFTACRRIRNKFLYG